LYVKESKLTRGLRNVHYLDFEASEGVIDDVVTDTHLLIDGTLVVPEVQGILSLEEHLGPNVMELSPSLRDRLRRRYGEGVTDRELNLVAAGASLAIAAMQGWARLSDEAAAQPGDRRFS
jgi:hypothetical protein